MTKNIVSTFGKRPLLRKPTDKIGMSVLIGIICPDAIVVAAESQISNLGTGEYSYVDKISVVNEFWPGAEILVAQGGLWPLTNRVVDNIREKAKGVRISSAKIIKDIIEDSVRAAKFPLDEEQKDYINRYSTGLLVAFYVGKKPHLFTVDCYGSGYMSAAEKHYATMEAGGGVLASYLLNEYVPQKSHSDFAIAASIFAIAKSKLHQRALCGGDTIIKRLYPFPVGSLECQYKGKSQEIGQDFVNLTEKRLLKFDHKTKKGRDKQVYEILRKTGSELWVKYRAKLDKDQEERLSKLPKNNP